MLNGDVKYNKHSVAQGFPESLSKESLCLGCDAQESDTRVQLTARKKTLEWLNPQARVASMANSIDTRTDGRKC